jgi:hypothetical protein
MNNNLFCVNKYFLNVLISNLKSFVRLNKKKYESFIYDQWCFQKKFLLDNKQKLNSLNSDITYTKDLYSTFYNFQHINYKNGRTILSANNKDQKYILKFDFISTILLEFLIGYNVVNKLADLLPTFIYTHQISYIKGEPIFIDGFPSFHLCKPFDLKDINKKNYDETQAIIILDHIDGNCLYSEVKNISLNDLALIILNIFISLKISYKKFKFTHWDLHTENIILKKYDKNYFEYKGIKYKVGSFIPVIFDYGLSAATIDNFRIETYERMNNGMNPKWVNKFTDVWKFLVSLICDCWYHDKYDHYQFLKSFMLKFFIPGVKSKDFFKFILKSSNNYYFFKQNKFFNKSFNNLINSFVEHVKIRDKTFSYIIQEEKNYDEIIKIEKPIYDKNLLLEKIIKNNDILKLFLLPNFVDSNMDEWKKLVKKYMKYDPFDLLDKLRYEHIVVPIF